ncbi:MAG: triose-phosphate isomerase [Gemmatimonadetes bacterium]|nr:triose-phosphate isomerase [Gemmatimonadota bacterium]
MTKTIFAANWKMNHGPPDAGRFLDRFLDGYQQESGRELWFFPPAVSIQSVAQRVARLPGILVGAQNVYWEPKGAFTGELSVSMAKDAGARSVLVGHSERRHVFGETDDETGRKVRAVLGSAMTPLLCVGETLSERDNGKTLAVIHRQLAVLDGLDGESLARIVIAYEPVWAIGTGKNATPADAGTVHAAIHSWFEKRGVVGGTVPVLYGGSVKPENAQELLSEDEIDGVLVGGASLEPKSWQAICAVGLD